MCAADEIVFVDAVYGADLNTSSASGAKRIVYGREIVFDLYSACGASLFALFAADTAVCAILACQRALVMIGAFDDHARGVIDQLDYVVGAGADADTATYTLDGSNTGNTVFNADSIVGAFVCTVAVAEAGEGTALITLIKKVRGGTGLSSSVNVLALNNIAGSSASNIGNLFDNALGFNTEYACDRASGGITAGGAEIGLVDLFFCQRLCVTVASGKSASSAVCAGEAITDSGGGFVFFRAEEDTCQCEQDSASKRDARQN